MITRPTPRFWLMTTAALILATGAQAANAQDTYQTGSYQMGAPTMVAAAPSFPDISPEQIARDVTETYNPRTGQKELVAAPFDAFEDDPTLAGAVQLRSAGTAVAIDGRPLNDGALLEVDFYYNSSSDDPYGGRGYSEASFVNGELAPVVLRDSRVLECSTRVDKVVYDHASYYNRSHLGGLYRPYRHYSGHRGFGFGFGNNYYGPGYRYYGRNRNSGHRNFGGSRHGNSSRGRTGTHSRVLDAVRGRDNQNDRRGTRTRSDNRNGRNETTRNTNRRQSEREIENRLSRIQSYGGSSSRGTTRQNTSTGRNATRSGNPMRGVNARPRLELAPPPAQSRRATPAPRSQTRATPPAAAETRSQPRRAETARSAPARATRSAPRSERRSTPAPKRSTRTRPTRQSGSNQSSRRQLDFFPNDGYGGREVVTSRSVDCAREDKLRVFIPNARLDAARFDGLTVIALDAQGGETPIYLPPNYIEGYRLAASGQVRPQGFNAAPSPAAIPQYNPQPNRAIESAPCPAGTSKQADGTCLQSSGSGYPAR